MEKIKLLTFSGENSFGAMLQCYALSKLLSEWGYEVELLKIPLTKRDYGLIGNITYRLTTFIFDKFRNRRLPHFIHFEECKIEKDDVFIVGSDQVWNPDLTNKVALRYFFNFLPDKSKRISYAASFGNSEWIWDDIRNDVRDCLKKFSAISVRETSGAKICKDTFHLDASVVLDPTLLLNSYEELIGESSNTKKALVFFSLLKTNSKIQDAIRYAAKRIDSESVMLGERQFHKGIRTVGWLTVENWLSQIKDSSFVITNSFHCMVFAIIFRKQFVVIPGHANRSGRVLNLLNSLGLNDRYYNSIEDLHKTDDWLEPIDYSCVIEKLEPLKSDSIAFLRKALNKDS